MTQEKMKKIEIEVKTMIMMFILACIGSITIGVLFAEGVIWIVSHIKITIK